MVTALDHYVGQLLDALEEAGLSESTRVVFTSDNGGHPEYSGNAPLRGSKWNLYEGGIRVPLIVRSPGEAAPGAVCDAPVWSLDFFPTFASWAGANLTNDCEGRDLRPLLTNPELDDSGDWP